MAHTEKTDNNFYIYLDIDPYLAQWFINEQGGNNPVQLKRGCMESNILEQFLKATPNDILPDIDRENKLPIIIPEFRHKPPISYNYLPPKAMQMLINCIRNRFDLELWNSLHKFTTIFRRQDELIYAFMEKHNIEINDTNWNAIAKRYRRKRDLYHTYERIKRYKKKKKESKE
ncbi:MAG: hypothetical protein IJ328_00770 [Muribaculaceae bacterium]|nr:hypothetical protein [Muribaculaceae bacterium]